MNLTLPTLPDGRVLEVLRAPSHVLSVARLPADPADPVVVQLCADLVATMRFSRVVWGSRHLRSVSAQAFCVDVSAHPKTRTTHGLIVLVNAEIVEASRDEKVVRAACRCQTSPGM